MKATELRTKSEGELKKLLNESRSELQQLIFDVARGRVKNIRELRAKKRMIAQLQTVLAERKKKS